MHKKHVTLSRFLYIPYIFSLSNPAAHNNTNSLCPSWLGKSLAKAQMASWNLSISSVDMVRSTRNVSVLCSTAALVALLLLSYVLSSCPQSSKVSNWFIALHEKNFQAVTRQATKPFVFTTREFFAKLKHKCCISIVWLTPWLVFVGVSSAVWQAKLKTGYKFTQYFSTNHHFLLKN